MSIKDTRYSKSTTPRSYNQGVFGATDTERKTFHIGHHDGKGRNPQLPIAIDRSYDYERGERFTIDRDRGSQRSRGSIRSRGSYSSSTHGSEKPLQEKVKDCCRMTIAFIFSNVGVCAMFVGYTIMGSFIFQVIERNDDAFKDISVEAERNRTIAYLWNITHHFNINNYRGWNDSTAVGVSSYQKYVIDAITRGYNGNDNATSYDPWSFEGGFLYSLTVITTIGYGHIVPKTTNGKIMTIVYTIFGMPVFLLYMANIGDILAKGLKWTYAKICICRHARDEQRYQPSAVWRSAATMFSPVDPRYPAVLENGGGEGFELDPGQRRVLHTPDQISIGSESWRSVPSEKTDLSSVNIPITISLVILFALLYGGTELFQSFEDWDPLTSFYFCFISLTTIGFGDIVPGTSVSADNRINFIYCALYLMFGLALLSMCFNLMQEEVVHKVTTCVRSVTFFKRRKELN
ncbi:potassium channel subfamily K member 18 isoform X2 [Hyalella azteca]|uniref:Potassium channel subfamily K member 18 isoform X2 n=1 Tax=Hyalella azteca TaxID=294128 RepID=A0A8B7P7X4_HYAAZ|nr:potassium channel subfamily K member 18 isoform X2 [Hyalella azteca]